MMSVSWTNTSGLSDEAVKAIVDFVAPCMNDVALPVHIRFWSYGRSYGSRGRAFWPSWMKLCGRKPEVFHVLVRIGSAHPKYPIEGCYKKRAGSREFFSLVEEVVHTLAHELRHVEQFDRVLRKRIEHGMKFEGRTGMGARTAAMTRFGHYFRWVEGTQGFKSNSCEVDAELLANALLDRYRYYVENVLTQAA